MHRSKAPLLAITATALSMLCACQSAPQANAPWARPFPTEVTRAGTLDIQVVRKGTSMTMTNTTTRSFGPCTIWLNMQWALPIDGFASGETLTLDLHQFRNEYNEHFRAGGFFAVERPDTIALAQIETVNEQAAHEVVGLVTVNGAAE